MTSKLVRQFLTGSCNWYTFNKTNKTDEGEERDGRRGGGVVVKKKKVKKKKKKKKKKT